ncbi:hypothetical protein GGI42DRAFT_20647 [Trichoderma sp. SZMC 28013]
MSMWLTQKSAAKGIWRYMCFGLRALLCPSRSTPYNITTTHGWRRGKGHAIPWTSPIRWMQPYRTAPRPTVKHLVMTTLSLHMFISRIIRGFVGRLPLFSKLLVMARFVSIL